MCIVVDVVVDENVRHGKPVVQGTRVTVEEVFGMLEAGMDLRILRMSTVWKRKVFRLL